MLPPGTRKPKPGCNKQSSSSSRCWALSPHHPHPDPRSAPPRPPAVFPWRRRKEEKLGMSEIRLLPTKKRKKEWKILNRWCLDYTTNAQVPEQKGGRVIEPVLKAEARPAEPAHTAGVPTPSTAQEGGAGSSGYSLHSVPGPLAPGLSPGHSIVQVLTYLPTFPSLLLPTGYSVLWGPSLLSDLLDFILRGQNCGAWVPIKVKFHWCEALSSPPPAELFFAWASSLGSHVSPPWPSSETPASSVCFDASSLLSHRQPPGCYGNRRKWEWRFILSSTEMHAVLPTGKPGPASTTPDRGHSASSVRIWNQVVSISTLTATRVLT